MPLGVPFHSYKAVVFDVDGTLMDSIQGLIRGLSDAFEKYGTRRYDDAEIRALIGTPLVEQLGIAMGETATDERIREAIDYTIERYAFHHAGATTFEPAIQALREFSAAGWKCALATSKNATEMRDFWEKFPAKECIDAAVCASDVSKPKPDGESGTLACKLLGVDPSEAVLIGDSIFDLRCARSAGLAAIAVSYGSTDSETLRREAPDALFESPEALLQWVRETLSEQHEKTEKRDIDRAG